MNELSQDQVFDAIAYYLRKQHTDSGELLALKSVFYQIYSQGSLMGSDYLQLISLGIPVVHAIADLEGKDPKTILFQLKSGKVQASTFHKAMVKIISEGGDFYCADHFTNRRNR